MANIVSLKNVNNEFNIAWSWRYKQLLNVIPTGEQCSAKEFALAYVENDLDLIDENPEMKFSTWETSTFDQEVQDYTQQFREEKNKDPSPTQDLLNDDDAYAMATMAEDQIKEYRVLRAEIFTQHLRAQELTIVDALISLTRLSFQRRAELMQFRHNETDRHKIKQHRSSISYFNREITAVIRQIAALQKHENTSNPTNMVRLL